MTNLKTNICVSYLSQIYLIIISLAILPIYIKYMGAEAYGLVGFFTMLQGIFNLLDFGLTPTIGRQAALYNAGSETALNFRQLFRSLSLIFIAVASAGGGVLLYFNNYIAEHWLRIENLQLDEVLFCLQVMAICIALRWMTGLYRGVISGYEYIVWLSISNILIATLRFPGVVIYMFYFGFTVKTFFLFQLFIAILEFIMLAGKCYKLLPKIEKKYNIGWSLKPIKPLLGFSLIIAFTSSIWILLTNIDKLILSGILNLSEYGYFTLAVLVAGGILQIATPISAAIMPRMARLYGEKNYEELKKVYIDSTQFISVFVVTAGIVLTILSKQILYIWTGDMELASKVAPILQLYAIGNTLLTLCAFPYYLQYAKGDLRLHFIGNILILIMFVPMSIFASIKFGAIGAGWTWVLVQLSYLLIWVTFVHNKIEPNINRKWFMVFLPNVIINSILLLLVCDIFNKLDDRIILFFLLLGVCSFSLIISYIGSSKFYRYLKNKFFIFFS